MNRSSENTSRTGMAGPALMFAVIGSLFLLGWVLSLLLSQETRFPSGGNAEIVKLQPDQTVFSTSPQLDSRAQPTRFAVTINQPLSAPRVETGLLDADGFEVTVSCQTCHATRTPNVENKQASDLNEFHAGLPLNHGNISCLSCHNPDDYDALKLADGSRVEFSDVMTLCSQCHGTQRRDYDRGAHGGMTGHWDLTRGPRHRNNCVDCHQPHAEMAARLRP